MNFQDKACQAQLRVLFNQSTHHAKKCKRVFVKIYIDHEKAQRDLQNFYMYVEPYFASDYYPPYQYYRIYRGKSILFIGNGSREGTV